MRLKQYNTPYRAEFISWSCSPKAAVPFREKLSAVIAPSCRAPLMFLPLASKTWSKGWASSLFALGFNRNLGHVTQTARLSRCGDTPFSCYPLISSWTPLPTTIFSSPPSAPLVYCSLFFSAFSRGHWGEGDVGPFVLFVISSEWWPKTGEFARFQLAKTTTENVMWGSKEKLDFR